MRVVLLALLLLAIAPSTVRAAGPIPRLPADPACANTNDFRHRAVLVVFDRTTKLSKTARERWNTGLLQILNSSQLVGAFPVVEIRESATELRVWGKGCLGEISAPIPATDTDDFFEWARGKLFGPRVPSDEEMSRHELAKLVRNSYYDVLAGQGRQDDETKTDSEIPQALLSAIASYCAGMQSCDVFIFSDLMDTKTKQALAGVGRDGASRLGRQRANELLRELHPNLSSVALSVKVWSFGRDDSAEKRPANDEVRVRLRNFWEAYFTEMIQRSAGGTLSIADIFASEGTPITGLNTQGKSRLPMP